VVSAARRRRTRRAAWVSAAVLSLAAAVGLPLSLGGSEHARGGVGSSSMPGPPNSGVARPAIRPPEAMVRAEIYASALAYETGGSSAAVVHVRDRVCATVVTEPELHCGDGVIPADVQRRVGALVVQRVRFVGPVPAPISVDEPSLVVFGALTVEGGRATLGIEEFCGPLCGHGRTLVLSRSDGNWRVVGSTGPQWIS
jgi:hypothetical protein